MDKKRSHNLEQKVGRKGKSTEGKCAQITMIPLCSMYRCSPEPPPVILGGVKLPAKVEL